MVDGDGDVSGHESGRGDEDDHTGGDDNGKGGNEDDGDGRLTLLGLVFQNLSLLDSTDVNSEVPLCVLTPSDLWKGDLISDS